VNIIDFLHDLKTRTIMLTNDFETMVRLEADSEMSNQTLSLAIFTRKKYYPFMVDAKDLENLSELSIFCIHRIEKEL